MTEKEATPKKTKAASKAKKPKSAPTHPKVSDMVDSAIQTLKERGGSSLQAIKKYISSTYKVDADKLAPFIRKYLKSAVANGGLVQTKGKGANGSFRIGGSTAATKSAAKPKKAAAKPKAAATPKKAAKAKKASAKSKPKKSPVKKAKPAAKKAKKAKTPTKEPVKASPKKRAPPKARK